MGHGHIPRTALITGASSGIGRAAALQLAVRGDRLLLLARRADKLAEVVAQCHAAGGSAEAVVADLCDPEALAAVVAPAVQRRGGVDVLVNNAGANVLRPFLQLSDAEAQAVWAVNFTAPAALLRLVLPGMLERRRGVVVNVCSIATRVCPWGHGLYAAAKSALRALTLALHCEHRGSGVRFCVLSPGVVATDFFEHASYRGLRPTVLRHAAPVEHVARKVVRLIDRPRLEVVVPSYYRAVDLVSMVAPRLVHGWMARRGEPGHAAVEGSGLGVQGSG